MALQPDHASVTSAGEGDSTHTRLTPTLPASDQSTVDPSSQSTPSSAPPAQETAAGPSSGNATDRTLPPLAPIASTTDSDAYSAPPLTPRTKQRQLHFSDTPLTHSYDPQASTSPQQASGPFPTHPSPKLPSASSSRSTALGLYSSSTPATPHREVPPPTLPQTVQDLRTLLKSFLIVVPSSLRKLRFLIPAAVRDVARVIIHQLAMILHARQALASNILYDLVAALWRGVINIFFREIRSRGAWKIPRKSEGATIFVVGPHHNQVRQLLPPF